MQFTAIRCIINLLFDIYSLISAYTHVNTYYGNNRASNVYSYVV